VADARVNVEFTTSGTLFALAAAGSYLRSMAQLELEAWELAGGHPNPKLARQVLLEYGVADLGALPAGRFWLKLMEACVLADPENRLRLSQGFPVLVATVGVVEYLSDGVERLVALLKPTKG
jgi:hypothetical protein